MKYFCTYFDSNYTTRALCLYTSLSRYCSSFTLYTLCLDNESYSLIYNLRQPNLIPLSLSDLEQYDTELAHCKCNRSLFEYYFTTTPSLPLYILHFNRDIDVISYVDADMFFYSDPESLFEELGDDSVYIIGHRFPDALKHLEDRGKFNVGMVSFRNNDNGRACLEWWRERCLEWCYDKVEPDRFADQKYLDRFPELFNDVVESIHKGADLAPWNISNFTISRNNGITYVDDDPLIFYHFHNTRRITSFLFTTGLRHYNAQLSNTIVSLIYRPYLLTWNKILSETTNSEYFSSRNPQYASLWHYIRNEAGIFHTPFISLNLSFLLRYD